MFNLISKILNRYYYRLDEHMKEVVKGAGLTFSIKIIGGGCAFGFNVLVARMLGAEGTGLYFLALTLVSIATTVGRCGLDSTLLRFIAAHSSKNEWAQVKGAFQKGILTSCIVSFFLSVVLFILAPWLATQVFNKPDLEKPLCILSFAVTPFALYWVVAEALKGLKRISNSQLIQVFFPPALSSIGLLMIGSSWGVVGTSFVYLVSAYSVLLISLLYWKLAISPYQNITPDFPWKNLFNSCLPLLLIHVMYLIMNWTSTFTLGIWGTKADIGIFSVAQRTAMLITFVLTAVDNVVAPKFSAIYATGDMNALSALARQSTKTTAIFSIPILAIFILAPNLIMGFFGEEFRSGQWLLVILCLGQIVNIATGSVANLLIMSGNERLMIKNAIMVTILLVILNLLLVPKLGSLGAAISTAICMAILNIGYLYIVWRVLGIWPIPTWKRKN